MLQAKPRAHGGATRFWVITALVLLALNLYAPGSPTLTQRALASLMIVIGAGTVWKWMMSYSVESGFLAVFSLLHCIYYGMPVFTLLVICPGIWDGRPIPNQDMDEALLLATAGLALVVLGYHSISRELSKRILPAINLQLTDATSVKIMVAVCASLGMVGFVANSRIELSPEVQQYVMLGSNLFCFATPAMLLLQLEGAISRPVALVFWGILVPIRLLLGVSSGFLAKGMLDLFIVFLAYTIYRHRFPWKMIAVGFLIFFLLQPLKVLLRSMVLFGGKESTEMSLGKKVEALNITVERIPELVSAVGPKNIIWMASLRLAHILQFAQVIDWTPSAVPYWEGTTYRPLLSKPIPRILYPQKPDEDFGQEYGHRYNFIGLGDSATSINLQQLVEFYANFGPIGVLVGSFILGLMYRLINDFFIHEGAGLGNLIGCSFVFGQLINIESNLSLTVGGYTQDAILVACFYLGTRLISRVLNDLNKTSAGFEPFAA